MTPSKRTALHEMQHALGARMCDFAGYEMPLEYREGLRAEHLWTRASASLFDVSHMGQLRVSGNGLEAALERALPVDFDLWARRGQKYCLLLNDEAGIEDDLVLTRLEGEVAIVVNASRKADDLARLRALCPELEFRVLEDQALIALQGPRAHEVLPQLSDLAFMHVRNTVIAGKECLVSRSGYTGEDGFEISVRAQDALIVSQTMLANPIVKPAGLGARDTLRLEAALHLYGQDLDSSTTPSEAGLMWTVSRSRRSGGSKPGGFPGAQRIERGTRRFAGLTSEGAPPIRRGAALLDASGVGVGTVTSGTFSPTLEKPVMLGYLERGVRDDAELYALVRGQRHRVRITSTPFVPKRYRR